MASAPANHDHNVPVGEEPMHTFIQTTVQRVVIPGFQNGLRDVRISANVFPHAPIVVGVVKLSAINRPY